MNPKHARTLILVLGALAAIAAPVEALVSSGEPITWSGLLLALGTGLAGWAVRSPGTVTEEQASKRVDQALNAVSREVD
jgi:hypothetical protein